MGHVGMKYSLVTRDLIADSTEAMALAHQFDALVMVPNCDKNVPGLLMAAARINVPTVFVSGGGPMLAGHVNGKRPVFPACLRQSALMQQANHDAEMICEFENKTCPTCGSCSGMYTANSMNCLTEVLGMGLKGNGTIPAVYSERIRLAKACRYAGYGNVQPKHPSERYHDKRSNPQCPYCRHGTRMLHKQYASPSGYCS